jgi:hypothetical protein
MGVVEAELEAGIVVVEVVERYDPVAVEKDDVVIVAADVKKDEGYCSKGGGEGHWIVVAAYYKNCCSLRHSEAAARGSTGNRVDYLNQMH